MATSTLVSVEEYLNTSYRPDCDYIDGAVLERNTGERDPSRMQGLLVAYFITREKDWGISVFPEQRVQVKPTRFRIPDLCVVLGYPDEQIFRKPPFLCIEILSPGDTVQALQDRIDDYLAFGVPYVWVVNPQSRRGWIYTSEGAREAKDGILRTAEPELVVPLKEVIDFQ